MDRLLIVAILAIMVMEVAAMVFLGQDGVLLSGAVAAVTSLATHQYTKRRCDDNGTSKLHLRSRIYPGNPLSVSRRVQKNN